MTERGYCECGCGGLTARRFVHGHNTANANYAERDCGYTTPCWVWSGKKTVRGYGRLIRNGRELYAHNYVWERENGPVPTGLELDHLCRNPSCCNPAHLEPVTHAENTRRSVRCVLGEEQVRTIRRLRREGLLQREIAERIGVNRRTVGNVLTGANWADVGIE